MGEGGSGEIAQPHDRFFKAILAQPGVAGALLRERLPAGLVARLGSGEPEPVEGSFVDEALRESQTDRLFRLRLVDGSRVFVYCLVEHKSSVDGRIAEQLLRYLTRIWSRLAQDGSGLLPAIVPLVVYHGATPWPEPRRFSAQLDADDQLRRLLLDFPYFVFDVGRTPDEELSADPTLRAGLLGMKYASRPREQAEALPRVLLAVRDLRWTAWELEMLYILRAFTEIGRDVLMEATRAVMPEHENEVLSLAVREWQAEWKAEAKAEGKVEGKVEERAVILARILRRRFGEVPNAILERLQTADGTELELWVDRAIDAVSLDAVFRDDPH
ncbi:MAG: Rpn family recombination-promoting nuclease/putative transposase [Myxococcaceae bacterium]